MDGAEENVDVRVGRELLSKVRVQALNVKIIRNEQYIFVFIRYISITTASWINLKTYLYGYMDAAEFRFKYLHSDL